MALTQVSSKGIKDATLLNEDVNASANIAGSKLADNSISLAKLLHGDSNNNGKFLRANNGADPTFESVITDLVGDTSPQLGGDLDTNSFEILIDDNHAVKFGNGADLQIFHTSVNSYIRNLTGELYIQTNDASGSYENGIAIKPNAAVELYHNNGKKLETTSNGVYIEGGTNVSMDGSANGQLQIHGNGYTGAIALDGSAMNIYTNSGSRAIKFGINEAEKVNIDTSGHLNIPNDSGRLRLGASADLQLYHNGTDNYIENLNGTLKIRLASSADFIELQQDRDVWIKGNPKPWDNNTYALGTSSYKWSAVHATTYYGDGSNLTGVSGGKVVQVLQTTSNNSSTSSGSFQDAGLSQAITMTSSANKILIIVSGTMNNSSSGCGGGISIFRGTANLAHSNDVMASYFGEDNSNNIDIGTTIHKLDTPGAGTHTYALKLKAFSGTQRFGYRNTGVLTVIELDYS